MATALALISMPIACKASDFDDCILQYMGGASNKDAVYSIETACINKTSVPTNLQIFSKALGTPGYYNPGDGRLHLGILIQITNDTAFDITQITVLLTNKKTKETKTYVRDDFSGDVPQGAIVTGLGEPAKVGILRKGQVRTVLLALDDVAGVTPSNLFETYSWFPLGTKGIPNP